LVLSLVTLALFAVQHRRFEYRATYEYGQKGEMLAAAAHKEWKAKREALYAGAQPPDAQQGEAIYKARCSSCHAFDRKIVGPPYREVVPKYAGDPDDLVAFILKPRRMNPAYPPMPSPGLRRPEAQSAAMYLLQQTGTGAP
jgi:cytochrome c